MAYLSTVADLQSVSLLFLFEVIPYTGARTLDGFVEFLEQSLKTPSTVSFYTFLPIFQLCLWLLVASFRGSSKQSISSTNFFIFALQDDEEEEKDVPTKDEL